MAIIKGFRNEIKNTHETRVFSEGLIIHKAVLAISLFFVLGFLLLSDGPFFLEEIRGYMGTLGWAGVILYIAFFVVGSFLFSSSIALSVIAPALFGPWMGFAAILAGNMAAEASMFSVTRWAGSHWGFIQRVRGSIPERLIHFTEGKGILVVFYARLMLLPASMVNVSASLLPISFLEAGLFGDLFGCASPLFVNGALHRNSSRCLLGGEPNRTHSLGNGFFGHHLRCNGLWYLSDSGTGFWLKQKSECGIFRIERIF